jgi:oligopeptide/dipeptide ABC transporter ATP-binding protein
MYMGKIVETAESEELFRRPLHPYTQLLLKSIPRLEPVKREEEERMKEELRPSLSEQGCLFQPRCPHPREKCLTEEPLLLEEGGEHLVACHFVS